MLPQFIYFSGEDAIHEALARRCVEFCLGDLQFESVRPYQGGKDAVIAKFPSYCSTARIIPLIVFLDLDDAICPPSARSNLLTRFNLPDLPPLAHLAYLVRESEAWILGDSSGLSNFLEVTPRIVVVNPEGLADPKQALIDLARLSPKYADDVCPAIGATSKVGPSYNAVMSEFISRHWRPEVAAENCPSLMRTLTRLSGMLDS